MADCCSSGTWTGHIPLEKVIAECDRLFNQEKKKELGTSCMRDFNFHTAHLLYTVGNTLKEELGEVGELAVQKGIEEFIQKFGQEYFDVLGEIDHAEF